MPDGKDHDPITTMSDSWGAFVDTLQDDLSASNRHYLQQVFYSGAFAFICAQRSCLLESSGPQSFAKLAFELQVEVDAFMDDLDATQH